MTEPEASADVAASVAALYGGPLESFVQRRDALAKDLRAAGRKTDAAAVKLLRKPARAAWALDLAVQRQPAVLAALLRAVAATLAAQGSGNDVRGANTALHAAVRELANAAADAAEQEARPVAERELATAVLAVLGSAESFTALRAGRLADIPDAGALDFLNGLALPQDIAAGGAAAAAVAPAADTDEEQARAAARAAVDRAVAVHAAAVERAKAAARALEQAAAELRAAEQRLSDAEAAVAAGHERVQRARSHSEAAAESAEQAERAVSDAKRALRRTAAARRRL